MPYIKQDRRGALVQDSWQELSFVLCEEILGFLLRKTNMDAQKINSQLIGEVWAAIEGAKAAFDEEVALPFEHSKRLENGSIFYLLTSPKN